MSGKFPSYKILAGVAALLFIAIAPLPYGYYTFIRIVVCGCAGIMAYQAFTDEENHFWPWVFGFISILFNPVGPIHMTKEIWMAVDALTGLLFVYLAYKRYRG